MHEHRDDEIISYMRAGRMQHTDSAGTSETISSNRLMVMNAGRGFSHEEEVVSDEQIEMLQIFVRPETSGAEPNVQFIDLDETQRNEQWRLLSGPVGSAAPSFIRQSIYLYDAHLPAGASVDLPAKAGFDRWLYVFRGKVAVSQQEAGIYTALMIGADEASTVTATTDADLVVFLVDRNATFSRDGTISG